MEEKVHEADFRFNEYKILKSHIDVNDAKERAKEYTIDINPSGRKKDNKFELLLEITINDKNEAINIHLNIVGYFNFRANINANTLPQYFIVNAPAILFPYVRAYISLLTSLSGIGTITLPTLNMSSLAKRLSQNIKSE